MIERSGQKIPEDFLTLGGKLKYFSTGFSSGFIEGLCFGLTTALLLPLMSDPQLRSWVSGYVSWFESNLFLWTLNCLPILIFGGMCCILSQYRIGIITKISVDMLLLGRLCSLIIKAMLIFSVLTFAGSYITPETAWKFSNWITFKQQTAEAVFRIMMNTKPHINSVAWEVLGIFFFAIVVPFAIMWLVTGCRSYTSYKIQKFWAD